jgi:signal-transduction protein with cAMP-binding, CBS, and nucleotidyltransferase domain
METKRIREIIRPYRGNVPVKPSLTIDDKIVHAVELMLNNNIKDIAVLRKGLPIGMVRLEDALLKLGIQVPDSK